jgi:hypothetical protein
MHIETAGLNEDAESPTSEKDKVKPIWVRVDEAVRLYGIGRSTLYLWIKEQRVRSRLIKARRDSLRGRRLLSTDSIETVIEEATK